MQHRTGEGSKSWFRSDRYYFAANGWWFQTREHVELGPYASEHEAEMEVCLYLRNINLKRSSLIQPNNI